MRIATIVIQNVVRLLALGLIALGVQFWSGRSFALLPVHMRIGETLIALLWILAAMGLRAGVRPGLALGTIVYGFFVVAFGLNMGDFLPGRAHEVIRVLHLLIGLGAVGLAESIGARIKRGSAK